MIQKNWNQEDLAKAGEVKQPTISRYLSGHTIPHADIYSKSL